MNEKQKAGEADCKNPLPVLGKENDGRYEKSNFYSRKTKQSICYSYDNDDDQENVMDIIYI